MRRLLHLVLAVAGLWAAWHTAHAMADHGHGLWAQAAAALAAYVAVPAGVALLFDAHPAEAVEDATTALRDTVITVLECLLAALMAAVSAVLPDTDTDQPEPAVPAATDYAKTA